MLNQSPPLLSRPSPFPTHHSMTPLQLAAVKRRRRATQVLIQDPRCVDGLLRSSVEQCLSLSLFSPDAFTHVCMPAHTHTHRVRAAHFLMVGKGLVAVSLDMAVRAWLWWNGWAMESPF